MSCHLAAWLLLIAYSTQRRIPHKKSRRASFFVGTFLVAGIVMLFYSGTLVSLSLIFDRAAYKLVSYSVLMLFWMYWCMIFLHQFRAGRFHLTLDLRLIVLLTSVPLLLRLILSLHSWFTTSLGAMHGYWGLAGSSCSAVSVVFLLGTAVGYWSKVASGVIQIREAVSGPEQGPDNPYDDSSWVSKMWYMWYEPLLRVGRRRQLQPCDVYELQDGMFTTQVRDRFQTLWEIEHLKRKTHASVTGTLWKCFWGEILCGFAWKALYDACSFAPPLLLNQLLIWIQNADASSSNCSGYFLTILMVFTSFLLPTFDNSYFYTVYRIGLKSRTSLSDAVQRKALVIHPDARDEIGTGALMNHITVDAEMLEFVYHHLNYLWSAPLRIGIALYFLYQLLGYASLVGFASLIVIFPFQGFVSRSVAKCRKNALRLSDRRIKSMTEIIGGIRVVKFFTWEESSLKRVFEIRKRELKQLLRLANLSSLNIVLFNLNPIILAVVVFAVRSCYAPLTANEAFTALSLLNLIRFPMMMLPGAINNVLEARIALQRLGRYLTAEEVVRVKVSDAPVGAVTVKNVDVELQSSDEKGKGFQMRNLNFDAKPGNLVCILGKTGCGKSSLLNCILGEISVKCGSVSVNGNIAYVPQQSFIINGTVEENILFGSPRDIEKLKCAICTSQLASEVSEWGDGMGQMIGERGINLSGGQKQRICVARAAYAESDIVLLDDPLSALDAKVGKQLFQDCILGAISDRTRIMVTNHVYCADRADWVIFMKNGGILCQGKYAALKAQNADFAAFVKEHEDVRDQNMTNNENDENVLGDASQKQCNKGCEMSLASTFSKEVKGTSHEEHRRAGTTITWSHLRAYFKAAGGLWVLIFILVLFTLSQALSVLSSWWLAMWAGLKYNLILHWWVLGYALFGFAEGLIDLTKALYLSRIGITAARRLHESMLRSIVRFPISFFDTQPSGRILNRVTKDQAGIDTSITWQFNITLRCIFMLIGTVGAIVFAVPLFLAVALPILLVFYWVQSFFRSTVRELKRLESTSRSPVYSFFSETLRGVSLIRAHRKEAFIKNKFSRLMDHNQKFVLASMCANRWLNMRLEALGVLVILAVSLFTVNARNALGAELVGFALTYAFRMTANMSIIIFVSSEAEKSFTAVERVLEYIGLPTENMFGSGCQPATNWPTVGGIVFQNVSMRYRSELPLVLTDVSLTIHPGEKIGVVGRTGSGKSSLFLALYRMVELSSGCILIDDVDISTLNLERLRSSLAIIPQDPILFGGTIRSNLDPFDKHQDEDLKHALARASLTQFDLEHGVEEEGSNFSVGQKQLLCLARALLRDSKILVLDEATASVDPQTDRLIQEMIRTAFSGRTVLLIAHRIHTVVDADRIMVLDAGQVIEFDTPLALIENPKAKESKRSFLSLILQNRAESQQLLKQIRASVKSDTKSPK